ncbi:hypothetical protein AVEN_153449-1 [Araneus ventricosus]|uniref:Uncharacterized protein n=1 Tax=Araneus ventricosus TaxID=182803 RepID=A0A4Y2JIZ2_ARAVE|nr:hypothetical protein AVEN_153449-1 [Araneus ventricosus]
MNSRPRTVSSKLSKGTMPQHVWKEVNCKPLVTHSTNGFKQRHAEITMLNSLRNSGQIVAMVDESNITLFQTRPTLMSGELPKKFRLFPLWRVTRDGSAICCGWWPTIGPPDQVLALEPVCIWKISEKKRKKEEQFLIQNIRSSFAIRISRNILVSHSSSLCRIRLKIHRSAEILTTRLREETVLMVTSSSLEKRLEKKLPS